MRAALLAAAALAGWSGGAAAAQALDWVVLPPGGDQDAPVASFAIGRREVTLGEYRGCVEAGACSPLDFAGCDPAYPDQSEAEDKPAVCVTWAQASAYSAWAGGRLPTEREWRYAMELAMGGGDAGSRPDISGLHGRVWEWVSDAYSDRPGGEPGDGSRRVVVGGDWASCSSGSRSRLAVPPSNRVAMLGFRVARGAE